MSKIIYVLIAILIYMIINLFIVIKKNTKILHFAGSILFLQVFLLSVVNSHFITLSEYSVCEYIFLFCMTIYAILVYFLENKKDEKIPELYYNMYKVSICITDTYWYTIQLYKRRLHKMKRFTAILLTGMMIFTLASCGKKAQDTPTEPATETQAAEKVEMPTETEAVTEVVTEATKETQQTEAQQEEQTAEQQDEEQNNSGDNNSSYQYVERASYENGESVSLNPSWQYADHSAINSGCAVMYKATANRKNIVVGVNAGHGTSGGTSVKTLCHPDGSAKTTGGTTGAGATKAVAVSGGMSFNDGTPESSVTLRMAQILKDKLLAAGYDVLMVRDGSDVQLDNVARTVICNNAADCHIALHWDGDGLSYDKGCFYISVPGGIKGMEPVASHWQQHDAFGASLIEGLRAHGAKINGNGSMAIDLTQTSYSTVPSVDVELGNACSDHSDATLENLADGLVQGVEGYF